MLSYQELVGDVEGRGVSKGILFRLCRLTAATGVLSSQTGWKVYTSLYIVPLYILMFLTSKQEVTPRVQGEQASQRVLRRVGAICCHRQTL